MRAHRRWLLGWLLGWGLLGSTGCLAHLNPVSIPPGELAESHNPVLPEQQEHVYVFLINGCDPCHYGNLVGVRDHLECIGYRHAYYGQLYHCHYFGKKMQEILAEDPQARFVVVGFSLGALPAYKLAQDRRDDGLPIDLVIFIAGKGVKHLKDRDPEEPIRVVDIITNNLVWKGEFPEPADRVEEPDINHFQAPTDYRTLDMLARELALVAVRVPVVLAEQPAEVQPLDLSAMLMPVEELVAGRHQDGAVFASHPLADD